jgi:hypothetical protein
VKCIGFEREDEAVAWAQKKIGVDGPTGFCRAVSCVDAAGDFVFVVVLSNFHGVNVDLHTAAVNGARWATPRAFLEVFNLVFGYVFGELKARRVTGLVRDDNLAAQRFDEHIGFKQEGLMREAFPDGADLLVYGFLKQDYENHPLRRKQ